MDDVAGPKNLRLVCAESPGLWPGVAYLDSFDDVAGTYVWVVNFFDVPGQKDDDSWDQYDQSALRPLHVVLNLWLLNYPARRDVSWSILGVAMYVTFYKLWEVIGDEDAEAIRACLPRAQAHLHIHERTIPLTQTPCLSPANYLAAAAVFGSGSERWCRTGSEDAVEAAAGEQERAPARLQGEDLATQQVVLHAEHGHFKDPVECLAASTDGEAVVCTGSQDAAEAAAGEHELNGDQQKIVEFLCGTGSATIPKISRQAGLHIHGTEENCDRHRRVTAVLANEELFHQFKPEGGRTLYYCLRDRYENVQRQMNELQTFTAANQQVTPALFKEMAARPYTQVLLVDSQSNWAVTTGLSNRLLSEDSNTDIHKPTENSWLDGQMTPSPPTKGWISGQLIAAWVSIARFLAVELWPLLGAAIATENAFVASLIVNDEAPTELSLLMNKKTGNHWVACFVAWKPGEPFPTVILMDSFYQTATGGYITLLNFCREVLGARVMFLGLPAGYRQVGLTCGQQALGSVHHVMGSADIGIAKNPAEAHARLHQYTGVPTEDSFQQVAEEAPPAEEAAPAEEPAPAEEAAPVKEEAYVLISDDDNVECICAICLCLPEGLSVTCAQGHISCAECFEQLIHINANGVESRDPVACSICGVAFTLPQVAAVVCHKQALMVKYVELCGTAYKAQGAREAEQTMLAVGSQGALMGAVTAITNASAMPCPECGAAVTLVEGCVAMTCASCTTCFCFCCNGVLPESITTDATAPERDAAMHLQIGEAHGGIFMDPELADQQRYQKVFIRGVALVYKNWVNASRDGNKLIMECLDRSILTIQHVEDIGAVLDSTLFAHKFGELPKKRKAETDLEVELPPAPAVDPDHDEPGNWCCQNCTYVNPPLYLVCDVCSMTAQEFHRGGPQ